MVRRQFSMEPGEEAPEFAAGFSGQDSYGAGPFTGPGIPAAHSIRLAIGGRSTEAVSRGKIHSFLQLPQRTDARWYAQLLRCRYHRFTLGVGGRRRGERILGSA